MPVLAKKTTLGRNSVRDFLQGDITHIAVGTGTVDPAESDTSLGAEVVEKAATATVLGDGRVEHVITLDLTEGNGSSLTEVGTKDGAAGNLQDRLTHDPIEKDGNFQLEYHVIQEPVNP